MPQDNSLRNTLIFLALFIVAFFPSVFQPILRPFILPFDFLSNEWSPYKRYNTPPALPACTCCPPAACTTSAPYTPSTSPATSPIPPQMSWFQKQLTLPSKSRGSYLITDHILSSLPELKDYKIGILHLFVQHTSCALSLNENWDSDVRADMSDALDRLAPADKKGTLYRHSAEGEDDMPAHIKSALVGASVMVPIKDGKLQTGTWQGIWYLEFRTSVHTRKVVATIQGEKR